MLKKISFLLTLLIVFAVSVPAKGRYKKERFDELKKEIGLTDKQLEKIHKIKIGVEKKIENSKHKIKMEHINIKEYTLGNDLTKEKLKASLKKIHDERNIIQEARFAGVENVLDVLTDEQIKKIGDEKMLGFFVNIRHKKMTHHGNRMKEGPCQKKMKDCPRK